MPIALTRALSPLLEQCELTHLDRQPIHISKAKNQHRVYERALEKMGYTIRRLPETPHLPDGVFVEDTAVVLPEVAIITRPGAPSRREETLTVAGVLSEYRKLETITEPGTLDGGDVLVLGKTVYIGLSTRTNTEGIRQFNDIVAPFGCLVVSVPVTKCLHLKTGIAALEPDRLLVNPAWIDVNCFEDLSIETVHPSEPFGANVMRRGNTALCPLEFIETQALLAKMGYDVLTVDQSELAKAEAGLTCCSVIIE